MAHRFISPKLFPGPEFLCKQDLPAGYFKMGEVRDDSEPWIVQVLNSKAKEEKILIDRLSKFSDWKIKTSETTSIEEGQEAELFKSSNWSKRKCSSQSQKYKANKEVKPKGKTNESILG